MRIDEFEFRNKKGQEIEPTKAQLVIYIKSLHKDIKDLEAKLAEKEKIEFTDTINFVETSEPDRVAEYIDELLEKLAEKDKEIKSLTLAYFESETNKPVLTTTQIINQDKISFAVEQLTQAKECIKKSLENMWNSNAEMTCRDRNIIDGIYAKLDEQIEELTHQQEDKGE